MFVHSVWLTHDTGPLSEAVHIENLFDFGPTQNMDKEMFMRFRTDIKNGAETKRLYTDQAGLGMVERIYSDQTGIPGNLFPVTESVYIEDSKSRLSLLVDHATGASSLKEGWLEVMVDKRTMYDDARGMGEGVLDSRLTRHRYTLLLEPKKLQESLDANVEIPKFGGTDANHPDAATTLPFLSTLGLILSRYLEHPAAILVYMDGDGAQITDETIELATELPCGYELVNLRTWDPSRLVPPHTITTGTPGALMIMRRLAPDCSWISLTTADCSEVGLDQFRFRNLNPVFRPVTLTGNFEANLSWASAPVLHHSLPTQHFSPMEIASFNVTFHQAP